MSFDLMFQNANNLYEKGAYQEAEKIYRSLLLFMPENPDILNMLGLVAAAQGADEEAISFFYKALQKAPHPLPIYFNLGISLTAVKKFDEAIEAYQNVLNLDPNIKEAYRNLGLIKKRQGDKKSALAYFQKALEKDPDNVLILTDIANLKKDTDTLLRLIERFPDAPYPLYHLAVIAFDKNDFKTAFQTALKADTLTEDEDIKNLLAQIYLQKNDNKNAALYFKQCLNLNRKNLDALIHLGTFEDNETYFQKALSLDPNNLAAHIKYGDFLYLHKRSAEALEEYHKAVLINPDIPSLSNNTALILKDMGDYRQSLDLFLNAFLKDKTNQAISINLFETLVLFHAQNPDEALKIAKLWKYNAPKNPFAERICLAFENKIQDNDTLYAQNLFDEFAPYFESQMHQIKYNIFNKIKELDFHFKGKVLDLGCGTGLAAENLKEQNSEWTGVDLSENMLQKAEEKNLYHHLYQNEISQFFQKNNIKYDFILILDVFEYTKEIKKIISFCSGTELLMTTEVAQKNIKTFALSETGRYQHNTSYVKTLLEKNGYRHIQAIPLVLRQEAGKDVAGILWHAF